MSNGQTSDWSDEHKKNPAVHKFVEYLQNNQTQAERCVGNDAEAKRLFQDETKMMVPDDARVIVFPTGTKEKNAGGSVIVQIPAPKATETDRQECILGTYEYWKPPI